ncbi:hypothetical protein HY631_00445 [Candidatus Uhrbacteria bacterium]|nr:hypothetical protein [Candidatus Uhrbacteria bacterium]
MQRTSLIVLSLLLIGAGCAGKTSTSADGGIFKSLTSGEEWAQTVIVPTAAGIGTLATTDVLNMEMDPQDDTFIYLGTRQNGMLYSRDSGTSWLQPEAEALQDGLIYRIEVDPSDVCTVYVAKGSRLYSTHDCMRSFDSETYVENRSGVSVVQVAADWYDTDAIWLGLSNGDVLKSDDGGETWRTVLKTGEEISSFLIHATDSRDVLVSTFDKGIYKTENGGADWEEIDGGLRDLQKSDKVYTMIQSEDSGVVVAATGYGLVRSKDFGSTWEAIQLVTSPGQVSIRAVGMDVTDPDTLYYAANATFYRSDDAGATWNTQRIPSSRVPRALLVDPDEPEVLYIGVATATE